jgi:hypothetical protein
MNDTQAAREKITAARDVNSPFWGALVAALPDGGHAHYHIRPKHQLEQLLMDRDEEDPTLDRASIYFEAASADGQERSVSVTVRLPMPRAGRPHAQLSSYSFGASSAADALAYAQAMAAAAAFMAAAEKAIAAL